MLDWAQEGKLCRSNMGMLQLLMASVMTRTPMTLSMNPARAWGEESQSECVGAEQGQHLALRYSQVLRDLSLAKLSLGSPPLSLTCSTRRCPYHDFTPGANRGKGSSQGPGSYSESISRGWVPGLAVPSLHSSPLLSLSVAKGCRA